MGKQMTKSQICRDQVAKKSGSYKEGSRTDFR